MSFIEKSPRDAIFKTVLHAMAVLLLTSIHHVYGAYIYQTPWRLHMLHVSVFTALVMLGALLLLRSGRSRGRRRLVRGVLIATILGVPILAIGAFEGLYNHLVKNLLYFAGTSSDLMLSLFPPPTYEMPNDLFFEFTGILQIVPAAFAAGYLYRMMVRQRKAKPAKLSEGEIIEAREIRTASENAGQLSSKISFDYQVQK